MKKPTIIIALALVLSCHCVSFAKNAIYLPKTSEVVLNKPDKWITNETIAAIEEEIAKDPGNSDLYGDLAFAYNYIEEYGKSLKAMEIYVKYLPADAEGKEAIYGNLARLYLILNRLDEAKQAVDKALSFNSGNITNRLHLVQYFLMKDMYKETAIELDTLSKLDPDDDYYHDFYVFAKEELGKSHDSAINLLREAVKASPGNDKPHRVLGIAIRDASNDLVKDMPAVTEEFNKALALGPKYTPTYISVANSYLMLGLQTKDDKYFVEAMKWFEKAKKVEPDDRNLAYAISYFYMATGKLDPAIRKLEWMVKKGYNDQDVIDMLSIVCNNRAYELYAQGKDLERGLKLADRAISFEPNNGFHLSTKAELLYKLGKFEEAYDYIKRAIVLEPDAAEIKQDFKNIETALREKGK